MNTLLKKSFFLLLFSVFSFTNLTGAQTGREAGLQSSVDSIVSLLPSLEGRDKWDAYTTLNALLGGMEKPDMNIAYMHQYEYEAKKQKNYDEEGYAKLQLMSLFYNYGMTDSLFYYFSDYMSFFDKYEQWDYYFFVWDMKATIYASENNTALSISEARNMYDFAKERNLWYGVGMASKLIGYNYHIIGDYEIAEQFFKESIDALAKADNNANEGDLFFAYGCMLDVLYEQGKYSETLPFLDMWWEKILKYEEIFPFDTIFRFNFYFYAATTYTGLKQFDKVHQCIAEMKKYMGGEAIAKNNLRFVYMHYYELTEEYDKALLYGDSIYQSQLEIGDMQGALSTYKWLAGMSYRAGKYDAAADMYNNIVQINDSLKHIEMNSRIDVLRTQYEVDKHIEEKERNRNYLVMAVVICVILAFALFIWIFYSGRVTLKNLGLVRRIQEQDYLEKELEKERSEKLRLKKLLQNNHTENTDREEELFMELQRLMKETKLYTENGLTRKAVADRLNTNEKYLHDAVKRNTGQAFSEYISTLRLEHAREMLASGGKNYTLEGIAADSGFGSRYTLLRLFRERYGLTPDEFRKLVREKN